MLSLPLSFLLCSPELPHSTTMSPCLLFVSQMSLPVQFQLFFLAFPLFCPTHQVTHPSSQNSGHLLSKRFLTACLFQFPPSYLWLYLSAFFFFTMRAILHTTIRCCFATHSFTITCNRTFPSSSSFCTSHNLLGYFFRHFYTSSYVDLSS